MLKKGVRTLTMHKIRKRMISNLPFEAVNLEPIVRIGLVPWLHFQGLLEFLFTPKGPDIYSYRFLHSWMVISMSRRRKILAFLSRGQHEVFNPFS